MKTAATTAAVKPTARKKNRFAGARKNILAIYLQATADQLRGGLVWYQQARDYAQQLAVEFGVGLENVIGVLSALSPGTDWDRNKADARQVLAGNRSHKCGTYTPNVVKAFHLLTLAPNEVAAAFGADKTLNFYWNILRPESAEYVTIDRHALSIALGYVRADKTVSKVEYRELAHHYRKVAHKLGILPQQLQAVSWVVWREAKGRKKDYTLSDLLVATGRGA